MPALTIGVTINGASAIASGGNYPLSPGQTVALMANKAVTWSSSTVDVTLRSTISAATQWSGQVINPTSTQAAFSITATTGAEATTINFALAPGDTRNGRYMMFGTNMARYALTLDFDLNEYSIVTDSNAPGSAIANGTFASNPGSAGEYVFNVNAAAGTINTARFRTGDNAIVGSYPFPGASSPMSFVAGRQFATSAADFGSDVDFQIFSREEVAGGSVNSSLFTMRVNGSVQSICVHPGITVIDACPVAPLVYDLTFNVDGSIHAVARPPTIDEADVHVARIGSGWVYLRASADASGLGRFRIGLPLQSVLSANATGADSRGNWGAVAADSTAVAFNGTSPSGATSFGTGPVIATGTSYPSGLFLFGTAGADQYFIGQS
ncbi:MAG TPA: hypothetical protein VGJ35_06955, partial [Burkholderiaceae bacterium]